jgi:hypothetical protein
VREARRRNDLFQSPGYPSFYRANPASTFEKENPKKVDAPQWFLEINRGLLGGKVEKDGATEILGVVYSMGACVNDTRANLY